MPKRSDLPVHDEIVGGQRAFEAGSIAVATALLVANLVRTWGVVDIAVAIPLIVLGIAVADLGSGLLHWAADTWGSEDHPWVGRRLLRAFRVHHVNPRDFLRRDFIGTNGDVAAIVSILLGVTLLLPIDSNAEAAFVTFAVAFAAGALPTNQIHQWAHMPRPPRAVAWLQRTGLILGRRAHAQHHRAPHVTHYCIATGWWNPLLDRIGFFRRLERIITTLTGVLPRADDERFDHDVRAGRVGGAS